MRRSPSVDSRESPHSQGRHRYAAPRGVTCFFFLFTMPTTEPRQPLSRQMRHHINRGRTVQ